MSLFTELPWRPVKKQLGNVEKLYNKNTFSLKYM